MTAALIVVAVAWATWATLMSWWLWQAERAERRVYDYVTARSQQYDITDPVGQAYSDVATVLTLNGEIEGTWRDADEVHPARTVPLRLRTRSGQFVMAARRVHVVAEETEPMTTYTDGATTAAVVETLCGRHNVQGIPIESFKDDELCKQCAKKLGRPAVEDDPRDGIPVS